MSTPRIVRLGWPEGLFTVLGLLAVAWPSLRAAAGPVFGVLPPLVLVSGLLIAWRFGRGRLLVALVILAVTYELYRLGGPSGRAALALAALLLPVNLLALELAHEAPPFS